MIVFKASLASSVGSPTLALSKFITMDEVLLCEYCHKGI